MNRLKISSALLFGAALALPGISHAQPAPDEMSAVNAANAVETVNIRVKNLPVGLVAYWLDPAHQPVPTQLQNSRSNGGYWAREADELPREPGNGNGPRDLKLPVSIESIFAIEPTNILRIKGTVAGIGELKKLVNELDVPLRQVEVEAQFFFMSPQTLKALPLKFAKSGGAPIAPLVALVPPTVTLSTELNKLIASNKVRIITAPRVTAIDGLTAQLMSVEMRALILSPLAEKPDNIQWAPGFSTVRMETGFSCTPVFHGDLIKLFTRSTLNNRSANVSANLRDGETIAIAMPVDKSDAANRTVIFVTARVIRRAGDAQ